MIIDAEWCLQVESKCTQDGDPNWLPEVKFCCLQVESSKLAIFTLASLLWESVESSRIGLSERETRARLIHTL